MPPTAPADRAAVPPRPSAERGIALLVVLLLTLIIVPFAAEFAYKISLEAMTAENVTAQLAIDNAIAGQYEVFLARLGHDAVGNEYDSYDDAWNDESLRTRTDSHNEVQLESVVFDEQSKLNVRMLAQGSEAEKQIWKARFVHVFRTFREGTRFDAAGHAEDLVDALYRWLNNAATRGDLPRPKMADDAPMAVLEELLFVDPRFQKDGLLIDRRDGDETAPGLHRYLTVYGTGQVNLNTAPKIVLEAFFPLDPDVAQRIIDRREGNREEQEELATSEEEAAAATGDPFTDVNQVSEIDGVTPNLLRNNNVDVQRDFTVRSDSFVIRIAGESRNARREELYAVQRVPGSEPNAPLEGFRHLLAQERTDPLEADPEGEEIR